MADEKEQFEPTTLYCATPLCETKVVRGSVIKGCQKCGGKAFVNNVQKTDIDAAYKASNGEKPAGEPKPEDKDTAAATTVFPATPARFGDANRNA
jgi:hypothetical protein